MLLFPLWLRSEWAQRGISGRKTGEDVGFCRCSQKVGTPHPWKARRIETDRDGGETS